MQTISDGSKPSWRHLLKLHGPDFLRWMDRNNVLFTCITRIANVLQPFIKNAIQSSEDANAVWAVTPAVMSKCNDQETYGMPFASEAYAWLHLLDRYSRTWNALEVLTRERCLPMGCEGVRVLDVGTGPGSSALAIHDYYHALTQFGNENSIELLNQPTNVTCVELAQQTNSFRHHFVEYLQDHIDLAFPLPDFSTVKPKEERRSLRQSLLQEEDIWYNELTDEYEYERRYIPEKVNYITQKQHRYRLIVFSNFLTTTDMVDDFKTNLADLFDDANAGTTILVLGGRNDNYEKIYESVDHLAESCGFQQIIEDEEVSTKDTDVAEIVYATGKAIYQHLQSLSPNDNTEPRELARVHKHFGHRRKRAPKSHIRAYRKPGQHG